MQYEGKRSIPPIRMLSEVHRALDELDLDPIWREHGVTCRCRVPRNGRAFIVSRLFSAEPGRLIETATLYRDSALEAAVGNPEPKPLARHERVTQMSVADVTTLFIGRLLDESTAALLDAAGESRAACPRKT